MTDWPSSAPTVPGAIPAPSRIAPRPCPAAARTAQDLRHRKDARADRIHAGSDAAAVLRRGRPAAAKPRGPRAPPRWAPETWPNSYLEKESETSEEMFAHISSRSDRKSTPRRSEPFRWQMQSRAPRCDDGGVRSWATPGADN